MDVGKPPLAVSSAVWALLKLSRLGSVRQVIDSVGESALTQTHDPYGSPYASSGAGETHLGFTGEFVDPSGLVYLRARYYQPGMGRFLSADPSRLERNLYGYGGANPVMFADPSGLCLQGDTACLLEVENLESRYGFLIYWPERPDVFDLVDNLTRVPFQGCPEDIPDVPFFGPVSLKPWTLEEVRSVRSALSNVATMIGIPSARSLAGGGIIYRTTIFPGSHTTAPGMTCRGGFCEQVPFRMFSGAAYSMGFSDWWDQNMNDYEASAGLNIDTYVREYWFIHEFGHVLGYQYANIAEQLYRRYCRRHGVAPSTYAATNASEFFAETFAIYVWERAYQLEWENLDEAVATVLETPRFAAIEGNLETAASVRSDDEWLYFNAGARPLGQVEFTNTWGNTFNLEDDFRREVISPLLYYRGD